MSNSFNPNSAFKFLQGHKTDLKPSDKLQTMHVDEATDKFAKSRIRARLKQTKGVTVRYRIN